ncbi:hypothetical protein GP486_002266 [Trichoglossum hirsutum]|uniref:Uncharacterized protein n=1 Tax=Trichoglossum hirsutum TaxID=265104 RepID=A0A9P8RSA4_9PEZI|nr:hypothetical protein GP486_002266 [Trichoglossum hirsutum]
MTPAILSTNVTPTSLTFLGEISTKPYVESHYEFVVALEEKEKETGETKGLEGEGKGEERNEIEAKVPIRRRKKRVWTQTSGGVGSQPGQAGGGSSVGVKRGREENEENEDYFQYLLARLYADEVMAPLRPIRAKQRAFFIL